MFLAPWALFPPLPFPFLFFSFLFFSHLISSHLISSHHQSRIAHKNHMFTIHEHNSHSHNFTTTILHKRHKIHNINYPQLDSQQESQETHDLASAWFTSAQFTTAQFNHLSSRVDASSCCRVAPAAALAPGPAPRLGPTPCHGLAPRRASRHIGALPLHARLRSHTPQRPGGRRRAPPASRLWIDPPSG
jgi:hypothetical protein